MGEWAFLNIFWAAALKGLMTYAFTSQIIVPSPDFNLKAQTLASRSISQPQAATPLTITSTYTDIRAMGTAVHLTLLPLLKMFFCWGVDGGWTLLPTRPQQYCDPASLVFGITITSLFDRSHAKQWGKKWRK